MAVDAGSGSSMTQPNRSPHWRVQIQGEEIHLQRLSGELATSPHRVYFDSDANGYMLESTVLESLKLEGEQNPESLVEAEAARLLNLLSGILGIRIGRAPPLSVQMVRRRQPDGSELGFVSVRDAVYATAWADAVVIRADGSVEDVRRADDLSVLLDSALHQPEVEKALRMFSNGRDWTNLYRIFEIIEHDCRGDKRVSELTGISNARIKEFCRTAGSPDAIGDDARHGVQKGDLPRRIMSLEDAQTLIQQMLSSWVRHKRPSD